MGTEATCFTSKCSVESAAETLEMPFILVRLDLLVALLRLPDIGSFVNCAWLWLLEA